MYINKRWTAANGDVYLVEVFIADKNTNLSYRLFRTGPVGPAIVSGWWGMYFTKFITPYSSLTWYFSKEFVFVAALAD